MSIKIVFPHDPTTIGGPSTFQLLITNHLIQKNVEILPAGCKEKSDVVFVIGGTRKLVWLAIQKFNGAKILFRLDGLNWKHKIKIKSFKHLVYSEIHNYISIIIRKFYADAVVYQSKFIKEWWVSKYGDTKKEEFVVYNGTDTEVFFPVISSNNIENLPSIICVEGKIEFDMPTCMVIKALHDSLLEKKLIQCIDIWGEYAVEFDTFFKDYNNVNFKGVCCRSRIPDLLKSSDIFLNLEIIPPCPNAVIEALSCGLPVVSYSNGAMKELVPDDAGGLANYGANPWRLDNPNVEYLIVEIKKVISNLGDFKKAARCHAVQNFDFKIIGSRYVNIIKNLIIS